MIIRNYKHLIGLQHFHKWRLWKRVCKIYIFELYETKCAGEMKKYVKFCSFDDYAHENKTEHN